jgi:hypothetical protein
MISSYLSIMWYRISSPQAFIRWLLTALVPLLVLSSCFIPDDFSATITIRRDGSITVDYEGDLVFALAQTDLVRGKVREDDPTVRSALDSVLAELHKAPGVREVKHKGQARYRVWFQRTVGPGEGVNFPSGDFAFFKVERTPEGMVRLSVPRGEERERRELVALGIPIKGMLRVRSDVTVLEHNASRIEGSAFVWQIDGPTTTPPLLVADPNQPLETTVRSVLTNLTDTSRSHGFATLAPDLCRHGYLTLEVGKNVCGLALAADGRLSLDGTSLAGRLLLSEKSHTGTVVQAPARRLVLFPPSADGTKRIIQACDENGECQQALVLDFVHRDIRTTAVEERWLHRWIAWHSSATYAVLISGIGTNTVHVIETATGNTMSWPQDAQQVVLPDSFKWLNGVSFEIRSAPCLGTYCEMTNAGQNAIPIRLRIAGQRLEILDPPAVKAPAAIDPRLAAALDELTAALDTKLKSDIDGVTMAFQAVYEIEQARRLADIFWAPLKLLTEGVEALSTFSSLADLTTWLGRADTFAQFALRLASFAEVVEAEQRMWLAFDAKNYAQGLTRFVQRLKQVSEKKALAEVLRDELTRGCCVLRIHTPIPARQRDTSPTIGGSEEVVRAVRRAVQDLQQRLAEMSALPEASRLDEAITRLQTRMRPPVVKRQTTPRSGLLLFFRRVSLGAVGLRFRALTSFRSMRYRRSMSAPNTY